MDMLRPVILVSLALIQSTTWRGSTAQLTYSIKATWMDDPEEFWTVAPNEDRWESLKENAENLGLTFAGKAEFPWIVDIRIEKKSQDYYSTGNLIRQDTVFTTCRAIEDLGDFKSGSDTPRVTFAQMYLFEYTQRENPTGQDWLFGGTRNVLEATKHKYCNIQQTYYDGGIITLTNAIMPSPPTINTIQLTINYQTGLLADFDLSKMAEQRRICYVAAFGRNFANIKNHLVKDFKVKYRVYWEKPDLCYSAKDKMCPNRHIPADACNIADGKPDDEGKELMCFKSRAKVGTVCDHDKGAPLVCDGQVFGLVVLGALENKCNDVLPLPFWVQKVSMFEDYFQPTKEGGSGRSLGAKSKTRTFSSSADPLFNPNSIQRFLAILFSLICIPIINYPSACW